MRGPRPEGGANDWFRQGLKVDPRDAPTGHRFAYRVAIFKAEAERDQDAPLTCWSSLPFRIGRDGLAGPVPMSVGLSPGSYRTMVNLVDLGLGDAEEAGGASQALPITVAASSGIVKLRR